MLLRKEQPVSSHKRGNCPYQPSFDLRRNIAKVVANYSLVAFWKNILLDIFVTHETPNYFQGDPTCFLGLLSELLKHCIDSLAEGEICIRIDHDSIHKKNNCDTELSIIITTRSTELKNLSGDDHLQPSYNDADKNRALKTFASILRIEQLCRCFAGDIKKQKLDDRKTQYTVSLVLQQSHPARMLYLA